MEVCRHGLLQWKKYVSNLVCRARNDSIIFIGLMLDVSFS